MARHRDSPLPPGLGAQYLSAIEKRDTEIMLRDKKIEEQQNQLTTERRNLHSLVSALVANGMSVEKIAAMTMM